MEELFARRMPRPTTLAPYVEAELADPGRASGWPGSVVCGTTGHRMAAW